MLTSSHKHGLRPFYTIYTFKTSATLNASAHHSINRTITYRPNRGTSANSSKQRRHVGHPDKQNAREGPEMKKVPPKVKRPSNHEPSITQAELSHYTKSNPPSDAELSYASRYFSTPARELSPIHHFRNFPPSEVPEVTVLGRSNVGKSSLLNALLGMQKKKDPVAAVSKRPGKTRSMNAIGLQGAEYSYKQRLWFGKEALILVDMPGYGFGSRDGWGEEIIKYLTKRQQYVHCSDCSFMPLTLRFVDCVDLSFSLTHMLESSKVTNRSSISSLKTTCRLVSSSPKSTR